MIRVRVRIRSMDTERVYSMISIMVIRVRN